MGVVRVVSRNNNNNDNDSGSSSGSGQRITDGPAGASKSSAQLSDLASAPIDHDDYGAQLSGGGG